MEVVDRSTRWSDRRRSKSSEVDVGDRSRTADNNKEVLEKPDVWFRLDNNDFEVGSGSDAVEYLDRLKKCPWSATLLSLCSIQ